jgi:hypothetical protein
MSLLIALLAFQSAVDPPQGRPLPPNTQLYGGPVRAVDYEARVRFISPPVPSRDGEFALLRSGSRIRQESRGPDGLGVSFSDFERATGISYLQWPDGRLRSLSINRVIPSLGSNYRREATGRHDRMLGEVCDVWRLVRVGDTRRDGPEVLSCETTDGVQLWTRTLGLNGAIIEESRTLSFRRRQVSAAEISPPAWVLRWENWRDLASPAGPVPPGLRDYEVRLAAWREESVQRSLVLRRRDGWTYSDSMTGDRRRVVVNNRAINLLYEATPDGRPITLQIYSPQLEHIRSADSASYTRAPGYAPARIAGETCFWSVFGVDGGHVEAAPEYRQCVTADGVPLGIFAAHHRIDADLIATAVSRETLPSAAMMPPAEAFNWAQWGIQPAD